MRTDYYELNGKQIAIPVPESYRDCLLLIKSDRYRISGRVESTLSVIMHALKPYKSSVLFWLRLCKYHGWAWSFCRLMYMRASRKAQVDIPIYTRIGYGLDIGHGICIVVNEGTIIGNNVNLSQFLNIGTNHGTPAIIGDNVYVGPNVSIVEDVKIGNNSSIGAGAVVTHDVPEDATVVGVPARVLHHNAPGQFIGRRWPATPNS